MSISLYELLPIKYIFFLSFIFLIAFIFIYYKFTKKKRNTEKNIEYLIDSQIFDALISIIFYLIIMTIGAVIFIFYFPNFSQWINIWFPLIAVLKLYKDDIKKYDKEVILFSFILCAILFISGVIMIVQKDIWGTYTGLKAILGAFLGIDAIFLLTLKEKAVFMHKLEQDTSLIKNPDSELTVKRIELLLGSLTTLFTFVNVIFYNK